MDNYTRLQRATALLNTYDSMPSVEHGAPSAQHLADILTDLRHLAADYDIDFDAAVQVSEMHFEAETEEE